MVVTPSARTPSLRLVILRGAILATFLFGLWLALSGHYTPLIVGLGAASSLGVAWLAGGLGLLGRDEHVLRFSVRLLAYLPWLVGEIVKSNLDVARRVLSPRLPIGPRVITVPASQRTALGLVAHANSITLTPGTLSIEAREGAIEVHALSAEIAEQLVGGEMNRRVAALENPR